MKRKLLAVFVFVVTIIAAAIGGVIGRGGGDFLWKEYQRATLSEDTVEQHLLKNKLYRTLKAKFPDDFRTIVSELTVVTKSRLSDNDLTVQAAGVLAKIRRSYAPQIAFAPDDDIRALIELTREVHSEILKNEGNQTCNKFGMNGYLALDSEMDEYVDDALRQGVIYFEAVAKAMESPITRGEPSDEDWTETGDAMLRAGAPDAYLDSIAMPDVNDPDLCPALIVLMDALLSIPGDAGERLRAFFAKGIVGN